MPSVVAGAWAHIQSPIMDARRMNKVTRLAFGGREPVLVDDFTILCEAI